MKPQLPSAATMALFMTSALVAAWLGLQGPINISAIKEWQTLIGFAGTLTVGAIAWLNVSRQLQQQKIGTRLLLLSREEDRIEKDLPGLKDAEILAYFIYAACKNNIEDESFVSKINEALAQIGFKNIHSSVDIAALLPMTDPGTRRRLNSLVLTIQLRCEIAHRVEKQERDEAKQKLKNEVAKIEDLRESLVRRQTSLNERLPKIRNEIERILLSA
jgi:hypothetical protein